MLENNKKFSPCPICNKDDISNLLHTKDYSLTGEDFQIIQCANCNLEYTDPAPSKQDIAPYYNFPSYISHTDTKEGFVNQIYHKVRNHTLTQKTNWVQSLFTGHKGHLLEIGAGTGAFAHSMLKKGWKVTALEPDVASRQKALENYDINLLPIEELFQLEPSKFEVITLWHVLEHVHDLNLYMRTFHSLLKSNGRLIIAVPNYTSYDAGFYKKYWAAYDVPRHLYHFSPLSMYHLAKKHKMSIVQKLPMWFDSFYVSLLSEKYKKSGIIGMIRAFFVGCISNLKALRNLDKGSSMIYEIKKID
ncbi:MAG: class I SAM-dependent methyltransferase [Chitinophagia bacterium]|jgi:2-polyprenyl-3-methyl-5-hydroxy-6-metoxy-1,4-benzoquinol methylase|nr:class I SAM-dependent methyltransferase [Chitinophagia bacterium]NCA30985.1 class I SAM-dependent methyltransferase [Chitinophagia bacterium]NDD16050.1 class I SAM-dependent methyltransferase [Chitinophagia bacterium]